MCQGVLGSDRSLLFTAEGPDPVATFHLLAQEERGSDEPREEGEVGRQRGEEGHRKVEPAKWMEECRQQRRQPGCEWWAVDTTEPKEGMIKMGRKASCNPSALGSWIRSTEKRRPAWAV